MPTDSKLKCRKVFVPSIEEFLEESPTEAQQQCIENKKNIDEENQNDYELRTLNGCAV